MADQMPGLSGGKHNGHGSRRMALLDMQQSELGEEEALQPMPAPSRSGGKRPIDGRLPSSRGIRIKDFGIPGISTQTLADR